MELPVKYKGLHWTEKKKVRELYIERQKGLCCHCGEPLSGNPPKGITRYSIKRSLFPKNFFDWPIHLHHNHDTGMTIGAVHNQCNAFLWQYLGE